MVDLKISPDPHEGLDFVALYMIATELPDGLAYLYKEIAAERRPGWRLSWLRITNYQPHTYLKLADYKGVLSLFMYLDDNPSVVVSDEFAWEARQFDICDPLYVEKIMACIAAGMGGPPILSSYHGPDGYHHEYANVRLADDR